MSAEVKKCPFCGEQVDGRATNYIYHARHEWCPFSHYTLDKAGWNRRATVSMEVAQKLADELLRCQTALDSLYQHNAAVRQAVAHHYGVRHNKEIFAAFNKEKGGQ